MTESIAIEIYENQMNTSLKGWVADKKTPYFMKSNGSGCKPLDEFSLPSGEWTWASNWRIDKKPGVTDEDGWEYAPSKLFQRSQRKRLWSRIMRREVGIPKTADTGSIMARIRNGLVSINAVRKKIEDIMKEAPETAESEQMMVLVSSVQKSILDISSALDQVERQQGSDGPQIGIIKKLRNDLIKEEKAIENALYPNQQDAISRSQSFAYGQLRKPSPDVGNNTTNNNVKKNRLGFGTSSSSSNNANSSANSGSMNIRSSFSEQSGSFSSSSFGGKSFSGTSFSAAPAISASTRKLDTSSTSDRFKENENEKLEKTDRNTFSGASSKASVFGGNAGAFNPSIFSSRANPTGPSSSSTNNGLLEAHDQEDGVFVDRTHQERLIEQKLKPVDEATVMQELIEERAVEIKKINEGIKSVQEMFVDVSKLVKDQQVEIETIFQNVDQSHARTKEAFEHIVQANRLQASGQCIIS